MPLQYNFFDNSSDVDANNAMLLEGFRYSSSLIDSSYEQALVSRVQDLPFREFEFLGYTGKRRVVSFGWRYDYSGRRLQRADEIPEFLLELQALAASFAGVAPESLHQTLVTEYRPGAGIGWHRDKAVFGQVVGVSLLAECVLRFRRKVGAVWERANIKAGPRSAYLLSGPARSEWEHSIAGVEALRYSITFRNVRER